MKAILWKELRENFRWAVLGCLVLTLAEFYVLSKMQREFENSSGGNITLTDSTYLMVVLFGSALVAVCLAAVQILPERNRDRWAALLHRPVSRGVIFWGKTIAGLGLYAAAVILPFLAGACYVAWPGKFPAPFVPGLLLPGFHALAGGVAFYFGALLLCLHRGRWLGTRGVLLLAVGGVFLLQLNSTGPFLLLPLVATSILSLAAWHTMLDGGAAERWTGLRRIAFVAVVLLGAQSGLLLVGAGLNLLPRSKNYPIFSYTRLEVTQEGQVLKTSSLLGGESTSVTDLAGTPITDERYVGNNRYQNFCQFWPLSYGLLTPRRGSFLASENALLGISYVQELRSRNQSRENWYLLVRQNYFIGYDTLSHRCVGLCDREGFKAPGAKPVPFEGPLRHNFSDYGDPSWVWTDHRLYALYFRDRQLKPFVNLPDHVIEDMLPIPVGMSSESFRYVMLALENGLQVLNERGQTVCARPYLHDPRRWGMVEVATNTAVDRVYLRAEHGFYGVTMEDPTHTEYLDELDLHGNVLHSSGAPIRNMLPPDPLWFSTATACLLPIGPLAVEKVYRQVVPAAPSEESFFTREDAQAVSATGWLAIILLALVLATVTLVWARQVGFAVRRAYGWTALVLAFGPAGLLAFRLASDWPEQVRCPSCGHPRGLSQDTCPHCQSAWNTPQPSGTEIFQPLPVQG